MITPEIRYEAVFEAENGTARLRPVLAFSEDGEPMVAGKKSLTPACNFKGFKGIVATEQEAIVGVIPGAGWSVSVKDSGDSWSADVVAFMIHPSGNMTPLFIGKDGVSYSLYEIDGAVEMIPPTKEG